MLYFAQGSALITEEEVAENRDELNNFYDDLATDKTPAKITFSNGELSEANVLANGTTAAAAPVPFAPIGPGKPLTLIISEVYTGKYPDTGFLGVKKDLLVTSAVKSIASFDAKPRAINFLKEKVKPRSRILRPGAAEQGTPVVFYSPALMENSLTLDLSVVFDQFPKDAFTMVGQAFQSAGGIPIFITASAYLLAAGAIVKLVGEAGEALFDGKPCFTASEPLNIYWPGTVPLQPGYAVITDGNTDSISEDFRINFQLNSMGQLVDKDGNKYSGEIPYIVLSIDGSEHPELSTFAPTAASTAILSKFYGVKDGQSQPIDMLVDAVKVYNDLRFRQDIDRLDKEITKTSDADKLDVLQKKREALVKNILNEIMKPT
ncbi:MAG: hypothetical protein WCR72_05925 [Bacteroidota bacterium]